MRMRNEVIALMREADTAASQAFRAAREATEKHASEREISAHEHDGFIHSHYKMALLKILVACS